MYSSRYKYLFMLFLVVYSHLNILFTQGDKLFVFELPNYVLFIVLSAIIYILWESNRLLAKHFLNYHWSDFQKLTLLFVSSVVLLMLTIVLPTVIILYLLDYTQEQIISNFKLSAGFSFRVNLFLNCVHAIYYYVNKLELTRTEAERLKKEQAEARLSLLQGQVNPHFLFNNLNVLLTLVRKNPPKAEEFIHQLSRVYRYILQHQDSSLTPLQRELDFMESYFYLLRIRFPQGLEINLHELPQEFADAQLPPMTLQILTENVIKHNQSNGDDPLRLDLSYDKIRAYLVMENNRIPRQVMEESNGYGLTNIKNRYELISHQEVLVEERPDTFRVCVPLLLN